MFYNIKKNLIGGVPYNRYELITIENDGKHTEIINNHSIEYVDNCIWISLRTFINYELGFDLTLEQIKNIASNNGKLNINNNVESFDYSTHYESLNNLAIKFNLHIKLYDFYNPDTDNQLDINTLIYVHYLLLQNIEPNVEELQNLFLKGYVTSDDYVTIINENGKYIVHIIFYSAHFALLIKLKDRLLYNNIIDYKNKTIIYNSILYIPLLLINYIEDNKDIINPDEDNKVLEDFLSYIKSNNKDDVLQPFFTNIETRKKFKKNNTNDQNLFKQFKVIIDDYKTNFNLEDKIISFLQNFLIELKKYQFNSSEEPLSDISTKKSKSDCISYIYF